MTPDEQVENTEVHREDFSGIFEGTVSVRSGLVQIVFDGPDNYRCRIAFPKQEPGMITLCQQFGEESAALSLVLEEGVRHISINRAGDEQLEITSFAQRVRNTVQKNGRLFLSYATELHGFRVENAVMSIELHKLQ